MATRTNPPVTTGTTTTDATVAASVPEQTPAAAPDTSAQPASAGTVRVQWNGWKALRGVRQERTLGKHTWSSDGWAGSEPVNMDADAWVALTAAERKADGFEEVD